ncbi:MAG: acetolactate synthase small subunit [Deltaproteobacteria bacterium]
MPRRILSVLVENHAGVLSRVSGLFSRRGFNIESLAVGITEDPAVSRMTIMVDGDDYLVEQISKQLNKLIDIIKVRQLDEKESIIRELVLLKVTATAETRSEIIQIVDIFRGNIIDVSKNSLTIEITGDENKINAFIDMVRCFGIKEMVKTGSVSIERGNKIIKANNNEEE